MSLLRRSRCVDAANAPQMIHWAEIDGVKNVPQRELVEAIQSSVAPAVALDALADVKATLEIIEQCRAVEPGQVEAVARDPELFELKISFRTWGLLLRIYETEDGRAPHHLIALRSHQKVVDVPQHEIESRQNAEIDIASRRWAAGRAALWGLI